MEWWAALALMIGGLVGLLAIGLPVAFAFFMINVVGAIIFLGGSHGLEQMVRNAETAVTSFALVPIPLFLLMGEILFHSGLAERAIDAVDRLISRLPGRLSIVAICGGTLFAALSGSSMANTAMLGSTLLPEMRRRGYHTSMSVGPIMGTGGIAILIPPSGLAVLLGGLGHISIADLLIAGILPGILIAVLFFAYVITRCSLNPRLAPSYPLADLGFRERWRPFFVNVLPLLIIFLAVVGSMLAGVATPSESAALGAFASMVAAVCYRSLNLKVFKKALIETAKIAAMIFLIADASLTFSQILSFSGATQGFLAEIGNLDLTPSSLLVLMLIILLILGCFMDPLSIMMVTLPFYMPLIRTAGVDQIWFATMMLLCLEIGFLTPPFGLLLFVMRGVAPPDILMRDIIVSVVPFVLLQIAGLAIIFLVPTIVTWLPSLSH